MVFIQVSVLSLKAVLGQLIRYLLAIVLRLARAATLAAVKMLVIE